MFYIGKWIVCMANGHKYYSDKNAVNCKFPFEFGGKEYNGCTKSKKCATVVINKKLVKWAKCNDYCKIDKGNMIILFLQFFNISLFIHLALE